MVCLLKFYRNQCQKGSLSSATLKSIRNSISQIAKNNLEFTADKGITIRLRKDYTSGIDTEEDYT